jgi:hypothetical protein
MNRPRHDRHSVTLRLILLKQDVNRSPTRQTAGFLLNRLEHPFDEIHRPLFSLGIVRSLWPGFANPGRMLRGHGARAGDRR